MGDGLGVFRPVLLDAGVEGGDGARAVGSPADLVQVGLDLRANGFRHGVEHVRDGLPAYKHIGKRQAHFSVNHSDRTDKATGVS